MEGTGSRHGSESAFCLTGDVLARAQADLLFERAGRRRGVGEADQTGRSLHRRLVSNQIVEHQPVPQLLQPLMQRRDVGAGNAARKWTELNA